MTVAIDKTTIQNNIERVAKELDLYYSNSIPLAIPILNGGIFFFVDLVREMNIETEMGIISTNHYGEAEIPFENVHFRYQDASVKNRKVLLIDEICFSGKTLEYIKERFLEQGALEVKSAVLINHIREGKVYTPDWWAVEYEGNDWLYGYGMDLDGLHRDKLDILK